MLGESGQKGDRNPKGNRTTWGDDPWGVVAEGNREPEDENLAANKMAATHENGGTKKGIKPQV